MTILLLFISGAMTIVSWLFVHCKNDPCFKCHLHGRLIRFYLGDELRYMDLDGQDDPYTFQLSMWEIYLQNDGDPPHRLNLDFCCLGVICRSFRIIPPNCGLWQEPLWKLLWPRMSQQLIWMTRPRMHVLRNLVPPGDCTPARQVTSWNSWVLSKFHSYLTSGCEHTCYISFPFSCSCKSPRWRRDTEITKKVVRK